MTKKTPLIAQVAVEKTAYHFDRLFDYIVPQSFADKVAVGSRVLVPFAKGNRARQGFVLQLDTAEEETQLKEISCVLDEHPILTAELAQLAFFIREHCFCTYYDAVKAMLPAGIQYKITPLYSVNTHAQPEEHLDSLSQQERAVIAFLQSRREPVKKDLLFEAMGFAVDHPLPDSMVRRGLLCRTDGTVRRVQDASEKMIRLTERAPQGQKLSPKQEEVVSLLQMTDAVSLKEVCYFTGVTRSVCDALVKKGVAQYFHAEVLRMPQYAQEISKSDRTIVLTQEQQKAYEQLLEKYMQGKGSVSLLYGVTGSGKTSVFMRLIDKVCNDGKGVIVMVPEIALTPQMIALFRARYGDGVAVFHSGLSMGERLDEWKRVRRGHAKVAIGTRSAVFAPFEQLGLIIMDEEQEYTYKSESAPRYHAREVAKRRCANHHCLLLLSSATPSVESFYQAKTGRYSLHVLKKRYGSAQLPDVLTADMYIEAEQGNHTGFSSLLLQGLTENLEAGKQSILLLNRRGHNTFVACRHCKEVALCPNCSISLTYHSANNRLMCHYCGYSQRFTDECPSCHKHGLRYSGTGTQRAEQTLLQLLPEARVLRLDADATMSRYSHEKLLRQFAQGEYDIMVGTQMVAKGLDFPNVTLVGVLNADQALYNDDFRSYERAFSLLTQVVGRSGRGKAKGRAVIQTFTPENPVIRLAAAQDYDAFFETEIAMRKAMLYPPLADICMVGFIGENEETTAGAANDFTLALCALAKEEYSSLPLRVLGPSPAAVRRVNHKYRHKLVIKCRNSRDFRAMIARLLTSFSKNSKYTSVFVYADINPDSIL